MNEQSTKPVAKIQRDFKKSPSAEQLARLEALAATPEDKINIVDIPSLPPEAWENAKRSRDIFKPHKEAISLRVDADVLEWFRSSGEGWQTRMNEVLAEHFMAEVWKVRKVQLTEMDRKQAEATAKRNAARQQISA